MTLTKNPIILMLTLAMWLYTNAIFAHASLDLSKGTMTAGGHLVAPYSYDKYNFHKFDFRFNPQFGYFVIDNLEISAKLILGTGLYWSQVRPLASGLILWGTGIETRYYFNTGSIIYPYIGAELSILIPGGVFDGSNWNIAFPAGLLLALNNHVGLNVGISTMVELSLFGDFERVVVVPGYFGVGGFF